ncbi:MAG: hypothetical protein HDS77_03345 [Bacteroidales bacterium]|nr:hypothetical protein [Bacteroidales bacterium]
METDHERALSMLDSLNTVSFTTADSAYYSLLYTQAQIKNDITVTSDTLINKALTYYTDHGPANHLIRANFYKAYVSYYNNRPQDAMRYTLVAYELAKEKNDYYWTAKSAEFISDIFFESYNYTEAENYTREAIENYALANRRTNHRYALCDLAVIYLNQNRNVEAVHLLDSILTVCEASNPIDPRLIDYIKQPLLEAYVKVGKYNEIDDNFYNIAEHAVSNEEKIDAAILMSSIGRQSNDCGIDSSLLEYSTSFIANNEIKARLLYASYLNFKNNGNYQDAIAIVDSLLYLQSQITQNILEESVTGTQRDFYSTKATEQKHRSRFLSTLLFIVIIVALIIISLIWFILRLKIRAKKMELEAIISSLISLKTNSDKIIAENAKLSDSLREKNIALEHLTKTVEDNREAEKQHALVLEHLFRDKWSTLNMLCNEYFEMGSSESTRNAILNNIEDELKKLQSKKNLKQLEDALNNYFGGIMTLLRTECTFLKEEDYTFLSLIFAGFSVRAVCLFTNIKYKHFYLKKSRLTKKIMESDAPHKDTFLNKLS